jgi:ABC-type lipopolysaccharide export system ATPase subunit
VIRESAAAPDRPHRLEARGLQKSYGARRVVQDVRLAVDSGEVVGLLGPNGAGKTTSFYMIVGLVRADAGEITIEGQRIERMPIHQRSRLGLSYLPQEASIFRRLTVQENIRAVLELQMGPDGKPLRRPVIEQLLPRCCTTSASRSSAIRRPRRFRAVSDGASRSRVRSPPSRASSCSTSRLPASTRSRSSRSSGSSAF